MVGVTYSEFLSWYDCGEIRICSHRVVSLEPTPQGTPDPENPIVPILLERIPQLNLKDEDAILLIQLKLLDMENESYEKSIIDEFDTVYLSMESIQRVMPLTERAGRILKPRMEKLGIEISKAYFEKQAHEKWFNFKVRRDLRGGDALVQALFEDGLEIISETLKKAVKGGIFEKDFSDFSKKDASEKNITWISEAFQYTRHDPFNYGELNYILDAGMVLVALFKSQNKDDKVLDDLRQISVKAMENNDKKASLDDFLKDPKWIQAIRKIEHELMDTTSVGFDSLVLFLRWKYKFQNRQQKVDFNELAEEASEFKGFISFEDRVSAVWILGCYVGYGNVVPIVYASDQEMFPFYSLKEPRVTTKISRTEKSVKGKKEKTEEKSVDSSNEAKEAAEVSEDSRKKRRKKSPKNGSKTKDVKKEKSVQDADKSTPGETKETTTDKSTASDKKSDEADDEKEEADLKTQEDQAASEPKTTEESEGDVTDKSAAADKKSDEADEEKEEAELKTQEDQTASTSNLKLTSEENDPDKERVSPQQIKEGRAKLFAQEDLFENDQKDSNSDKG